MNNVKSIYCLESACLFSDQEMVSLFQCIPIAHIVQTMYMKAKIVFLYTKLCISCPKIVEFFLNYYNFHRLLIF